MIFDRGGRFLFTRNPKTAGTSMFRGAIEPSCDAVQGRGKEILNTFLKTADENTFKFTFVRNPWDRMVSLWRYSVGRWTDEELSLRDFLKKVAKGEANGRQFFLHSVNQSRSFLCASEQYVDFIGRFENLPEDWEYVAERTGLSKTLPLLNQTPHEHYRECYNDETAAMVYERYKMEIDYLGYEL